QWPMVAARGPPPPGLPAGRMGTGACSWLAGGRGEMVWCPPDLWGRGAAPAPLAVAAQPHHGRTTSPRAAARPWPGATGEAVAKYVADNTLLRAPTPGLSCRRSKRLDDRDDAGHVVHWGAVVAGRETGDGWLEAGGLFLPMELEGVRVLASWPPSLEQQDEAPGSSWQRPGELLPPAEPELPARRASAEHPAGLALAAISGHSAPGAWPPCHLQPPAVQHPELPAMPQPTFQLQVPGLSVPGLAPLLAPPAPALGSGAGGAPCWAGTAEGSWAAHTVTGSPCATREWPSDAVRPTEASPWLQDLLASGAAPPADTCRQGSPCDDFSGLARLLEETEAEFARIKRSLHGMHHGLHLAGSLLGPRSPDSGPTSGLAHGAPARESSGGLAPAPPPLEAPAGGRPGGGPAPSPPLLARGPGGCPDRVRRPLGCDRLVRSPPRRPPEGRGAACATPPPAAGHRLGSDAASLPDPPWTHGSEAPGAAAGAQGGGAAGAAAARRAAPREEGVLAAILGAAARGSPGGTRAILMSTERAAPAAGAASPRGSPAPGVEGGARAELPAPAAPPREQPAEEPPRASPDGPPEPRRRPAAGIGARAEGHCAALEAAMARVRAGRCQRTTCTGAGAAQKLAAGGGLGGKEEGRASGGRGRSPLPRGAASYADPGLPDVGRSNEVGGCR
ncbi:unnamed protein product, partial [Prorocentrum cordatum]